MNDSTQPVPNVEAVQEIRSEAEHQRTIGTISGVGAIVGSLGLGIISGPIGIVTGLAGAALAARSLVNAERQEERAKAMEEQLANNRISESETAATSL